MNHYLKSHYKDELDFFVGIRQSIHPKRPHRKTKNRLNFDSENMSKTTNRSLIQR